MPLEASHSYTPGSFGGLTWVVSCQPTTLWTSKWPTEVSGSCFWFWGTTSGLIGSSFQKLLWAILRPQPIEWARGSQSRGTPAWHDPEEASGSNSVSFGG